MSAPSCAIVIPARFGSSRFPGKPLHPLNGVPMIAHVCRNALAAAAEIGGVRVVVATDHPAIYNAAIAEGAQAVLSDAPYATGSDRVLGACRQMAERPDCVVNLQGDAPLIGKAVIAKVVDALRGQADADVVTPVAQLSWEMLDKLRKQKEAVPFSGTTTIVADGMRLVWFSKTILPALRKERELRQESPVSPVFLHLGLYGYRYAALERFNALPQSPYETLEELEQLRFLENGMSVRGVALAPGEWPSVCGVDTPEDAERVEALLKTRKKEAA
jgi:3-deoxy-manno-octulosonate cytidylyltransferase (CMP-KDO synthetase)